MEWIRCSTTDSVVLVFTIMSLILGFNPIYIFEMSTCKYIDAVVATGINTVIDAMNITR